MFSRILRYLSLISSGVGVVSLIKRNGLGIFDIGVLGSAILHEYSRLRSAFYGFISDAVMAIVDIEIAFPSWLQDAITIYLLIGIANAFADEESRRIVYSTRRPQWLKSDSLRRILDWPSSFIWLFGRAQRYQGKHSSQRPKIYGRLFIKGLLLSIFTVAAFFLEGWLQSSY